MLIPGITLILAIWLEAIVSSVGHVHQFSVKRTLGHHLDSPVQDYSGRKWAPSGNLFGQVGGISLDKDENIYVFHRGSRVWNGDSFHNNNTFKNQLQPIQEPTILVFDKNGSLIRKWGEHMFFMPHGITVDQEYNVWVTDVGLHQVMKFPPHLNKTLLVLGNRFVPGRDSGHFCKPTAVAVTTNGDFFVSDGYCNHRILKFNSAGNKILEWGRSTITLVPRQPEPGELNVPHALTLAEDKGLVCVADRENGRIQCFHIDNGTFAMQIIPTSFGSRLFSVAYSTSRGGTFYAVMGKSYYVPNDPVRGYVINFSGQVISEFGISLESPHDVAVSADASVIFVGELHPPGVWRFDLNKSLLSSSPSSVHRNMYIPNDGSDVGGLTGAVLVTSGCLIFSAAVLIAALLYSRSKRTGTTDSVRLLSRAETE